MLTLFCWKAVVINSSVCVCDAPHATYPMSGAVGWSVHCCCCRLTHITWWWWGAAPTPKKKWDAFRVRGELSCLLSQWHFFQSSPSFTVPVTTVSEPSAVGGWMAVWGGGKLWWVLFHSALSLIFISIPIYSLRPSHRSPPSFFQWLWFQYTKLKQEGAPYLERSSSSRHTQ